jgi:restriction-modification enzyme MmeI-like protein
LLPENFFPRLLKRTAEQPKNAQSYFDQLFAAMENGGDFGLEKIAYFNGGLFDGRRALPLDSGDIGLLQAAASLDWSQIDPTIFGTLFERFLDPDKRAQIGAHYTDPEKIMMIVEPVILRPLREEWAIARAQIEGLIGGRIKPAEIRLDVSGRMQAGIRLGQQRRLKPVEAAEEVRSQFLERLRKITILDPACGSGNFLYLALQGVKDIELKANLECEVLGLPPRVPVVGPEIVRGIEINRLAAELARTTIWIGDIQWRLRNAIYAKPEPILRKLDAIECRDALITPVSQPSSVNKSDQKFVEAEWPPAEFIVGNPPFLGSKFFRKGRPGRKGSPPTKGLGDGYTETIYSIFAGRVPQSADFCNYWFLKSFDAFLNGSAFGLVATKSIAKGSNNQVLKRICASSEAIISAAWTNEPWVIDGAEVRVSLICVGRKESGEIPRLNGHVVDHINSNLTTGLDVATATPLVENGRIAFQGVKLNGPFEVTDEEARSMLAEPVNVNGLPNSLVVRRFVQNDDVTERPRPAWVIDFTAYPSRQQASQFQTPFEHLTRCVLPYRQSLETSAASENSKLANYWLMQRPRPKLRQAIAALTRCILVPETSEHRIFVWSTIDAVFSGSLFVIARDDDVTFGILCSSWHDLWATAQGNRLGAGNQRRYNATRTFETFPFPDGLTPNVPVRDYANDTGAAAIAEAARRLDELRNAWLNPPDLLRITPVVGRFLSCALPRDAAAAAILRERTLTNLYNQRPQWLIDVHRNLDAAVAAAYGWPTEISEGTVLSKLLELNVERAAANKAGDHPRDVDYFEDND